MERVSTPSEASASERGTPTTVKEETTVERTLTDENWEKEVLNSGMKGNGKQHHSCGFVFSELWH